MSKVYYIKSKYLNTDYLKNKLRGWKEYNKKNKPTFIYYDSNYRFDKEINKYNVKLKSVVNTNNTLTNKLNLYFQLKEPKYMPKSYINPEDVPFNKNSKYILRPVEGYAGSEIYVVKTKDDLNKCMSKIRKVYKKEVLISEYIQDLMLYDDRIFHLRVYFVVSVINKKYKTYMVDYILTARARHKYNKNRELNKNVYDSHLGKSSTDIIFPEDFDLKDKNKEDIRHQIIGILHLVSKEFEKNISCYPETDNCFELLGCDFMITKDLQVKLIEINTKVSYETHSDKTKNELSKCIFEGMYNHIINPVFNKKEISDYNWINIYD